MTEKPSCQLVSYGGWPNCMRLSNGQIELIATTDVGPRIIRFGFIEGPNLLKECSEMLGMTGGDEWRLYGGHRLWHAPEQFPRTYAPDNAPLDYSYDDSQGMLTLNPAPEQTTGIAKQITVRLITDPAELIPATAGRAADEKTTVTGRDQDGGSPRPINHAVELTHRLTNHNPWAIDLAPWCLTVMTRGGRAIIPQEDYRPHPDYLLPARPLVLWHYTDMSDPRWKWGRRYIQLTQDPAATTKQKVGAFNSKGWLAYCLEETIFVKRTPVSLSGTESTMTGQPEAALRGHDETAAWPPTTMPGYPDLGCNVECFTDPEMLELETLGPMTRLEPGQSVEQVEQWFLFKTQAEVPEDEAGIDRVLLPLINTTIRHGP